MNVLPTPAGLLRRVAAFVTGLVASSLCAAAPLTVANFGGANAEAQVKAFQQPFARLHGAEVKAIEYTGGLDQIRKMVASGKVTWDIAEVESADLLAGCKEGLFERIDKEKLSHTSLLLPGTVHECGVGAFVWSTVFAYDPARLKEAPRTWADFWNVSKFPGKRGMRKGARYNMEFALMADGVHRRDVYRLLRTPQGVQRALRKLEELRPHVVWWESGAQPPKLLASGEVLMSTAFNGRIAAANRTSQNKLSIVWSDAIYELDYWVVIKGSSSKDLAHRYIDHATSANAQLQFSKDITYGPTNFDAILKYDQGEQRAAAPGGTALIDLSMAPSDLPSAPGNLRKSLQFDAAFWIEQGDGIERLVASAMRYANTAAGEGPGWTLSAKLACRCTAEG